MFFLSSNDLIFSTHYPYSLAELATIAVGIAPLGSTSVTKVAWVEFSFNGLNTQPAILISPLTESLIGGNSGISIERATATH